MTQEAKEEKNKKIEVPAKFKGLIESIEKLTVIELAELVKILEEKFGVSASPQIMAGVFPANAGQAQGGPAGAQAEEKNEFNVVLTKVGDKKIEVIKAVRDVTGKGLKEAKDLVDAASSAPQVIKEAAKKEEAEDLKKKFEAAGAAVELK